MYPVFFEWGTLRLYTYGFFFALGLVASFLLLQRHSRRWGVPESWAAEWMLVLVVSGLVGARLFFVAQHWKNYESEWVRIFFLREGGLVFYGGLLGALAGGYVWIRLKNLSVLRMADFSSLPLVVAQEIGRIGCFFNGCCYGRPAHFFLSVANPYEKVERHPTQLYEVAALGLLAILLYPWWKKGEGGSRPGTLFSGYLVFYGLTRFVVEYFRGDQSIMALGMTLHQFISLVLLAAGVSILVLKGERKK